MNLPNLLSLLRILLIPLFVLLFYLPMQWTNFLCAAVFGLAGVTDWLDGYLARKWNQATPFGAFIDPVADKLMVVVALVLLVNRYPHVWFVLPTILIICREIVVSALREWMAELGNYIQLDAGGPNALDFHIAYYLGRLLEAKAADSYHIISKDKGFDALVAHVSKSGVACERVDSIEAMSCLPKQAVAKVAASAKVAAKPSTKKKADELVALVVANFTKRVTGRPRTEKTLRSTVKTLCGGQYSDKELDAVMARLLKKTYVVVTDGKVTYQLP